MIKVILGLLAFFCFAMTFGLALVTTKWNAGRDHEMSEEEHSF
jgi:hypothetical protein